MYWLGPKTPPFCLPPPKPNSAFGSAPGNPPLLEAAPAAIRIHPPPVVKSHGLGTVSPPPQALAGTLLNTTRVASTSPPVMSADTSLDIRFALSFIVLPPFALRPLYAALRNTR